MIDASAASRKEVGSSTNHPSDQEIIGRRGLITGGVAVAVAATSGCVGIVTPPPIENIAVRIVDVRAPSIGATSLTMPLVVEFANTGSTEVPDVSLRADVHINGGPVATAQTGVGSLGGGDRAQTRLNVIISYADVGGSIVDALQQDRFTVALSGDLHSDGPLLDGKRHFQAEA